MATKAKKPAPKKQTEETTVTRIKAGEATKSAKKPARATPAVEVKEKKERKERKNPFKAAGNYFAGAWYELKQVRWPNRKATWSMTAAMLAFTAFFIVLILLLDALFKYLFEIILG